MNPIAAVALLLFLLPWTAARSAWRQDAIAISGWVDPQVPASEFDARYAEMRAANFTVLLGFDGDPQLFELNTTRVAAQLAACARSGMRCVPSQCAGGACVGLGANASSPSFWGFQLKDEPQASDFATLAEQQAAVVAANPAAMSFINLLSDGAGQASYAAYEAYVSGFLAAVAPDVLSFDMYPMFGRAGIDGSTALWAPRPTDAPPRTHQLGKPQYRHNVAILRAHAGAATAGLGGGSSAIPFWSFFNVLPFADHYDPTEAQLRWPAFTSMAYGAKGFLYFCYWSPLHVFAQGGGIIVPRAPAAAGGGGGGGGGGNVTYVRGPHYAHARRLNTALLAFGEYLLHAASRSVSFFNATGGPYDATRLYAGSAGGAGSFGSGGAADAAPVVASLQSTGWPTTHAAWLVGEFGLSDGRTALLVHNQDDMRSQLTTVGLQPGVSQLWEVDPSGHGEAPALDDSPWMAGLQLLLGPGDARLLIVSTAAAGNTSSTV